MCLQLVGIVAATSRDTMSADDILNVLIKIVPTMNKDLPVRERLYGR